MSDFLGALQREIQMYAFLPTNVSFETVFFGGGTPSLLAPHQLESILALLHSTFHIQRDAEVTLETNPGTVTREKLDAFKSLGINRLSIGIQSFHEDELQFLSRIHDSRQAESCVELARETGFKNVSIDLMYSLPGQTRLRWEENLLKALALHPHHLSAYSLIVEDHTPLARLVNAKQVSPNPVDVEAELYECTMDIMAAHGYEHYEASNYALPGFRSRHNSNYWNHENYLGFGPSAHSFWKKPGETAGRRWWNIANLSHYCARLHNNELPLVSEDVVSSKELVTERIFLGLRSDGVNLKRLCADFGIELHQDQQSIIRELVAQNIATLENDTLRLTSRGFLLCDEISGRLIT